MTSNVCSAPFVVVLCSHNGARFVNEQVSSILGQNEPATAIHVHDFASRDGTREVLEVLRAEAGDRLTITLHDHAPGAAASFLAALRATLARLPADALILLADQDDVWRPDKLATIRQEIARLKLSPADPFLIFHDVEVVDATLAPLRPTYYTGNPFQVPRDLDHRRLLMANPAIGHTMLLSSPLARIVATWPDGDRYLMHDWLTVLIASRMGRVEQIPAALSLYRQHDSNVLGAYGTRAGVASLKRLLTFMDRMIKQAVRFTRSINKVPPSTASLRTVYLDRACRLGYRRTALALAWAAAIHGPTWQRKAISLLLLARGVMGPAGDVGNEGRETA